MKKHDKQINGGGVAEPLVSIITVVLNGEKWIEQTISSVLVQSYQNIEYIIIDGGSTDKTLDIIRQYEDKIDHWKSEKDQGISDAFNKGIKEASGELIGILNCGDFYEPQAVQNMVNAYQKNPDAVLHGRVKYIYRDKREIARPNIGDIWKRMSIIHTTMFVPAKLYREHGLFDLSYRYAMDPELVHRFLSKGVEFVCLDEVISNFRVEGESDKNYIKALKEFRRSVETYRGKSWHWTYHMYVMLFKRALRGSILHNLYRKAKSLFAGGRR